MLSLVLMLLLFPLPFIALIKCIQWSGRLDKVEDLIERRLGRKAGQRVGSVTEMMRLILLIPGMLYFFYADAKVLMKLANYSDCPCDAAATKKLWFCTVRWDWLGELRDPLPRPLSRELVAIVADVEARLASGGEVSLTEAKFVVFARKKIKDDTELARESSAFPPLVPLCQTLDDVLSVSKP